MKLPTRVFVTQFPANGDPLSWPRHVTSLYIPERWQCGSVHGVRECCPDSNPPTKSLHGFCNMTVPVPDASFFIAPVSAPDCGWDGGDAHHHPTLIFQRVDALLKETLDVFSMAFSDSSVWRERLAALVDCILRNISKKPVEAPAQTAQEAVTDLDLFSCPGCRASLGEPVMVACGHSCKRCLDQGLFSKCKACAQELSEKRKPNVILKSVLRKWFPDDMERYRCVREVDDLTRRKRFRGTLTLVNKLLKLGEIFQFIYSFQTLFNGKSLFRELACFVMHCIMHRIQPSQALNAL